jgi:hypothetical protein
VRKDPEVLTLQVRETTFANWLIVRMCFLLSHVKNGTTRGEIIGSLAKVLIMWKDANPKSWHELRKCTETIKSNVSRNH